MVFSSAVFLFQFLPVVLLLYYICRNNNARNALLFIVSLFFYAWGEPVYVVLMIFSTVADYLIAHRIEKNMELGRQKAARLFVCLSVIINLSLLGVFKYADFAITSYNNISGSKIPLLNLALPIGISFYTFQTMSYSIDVYRGDAKAQRNIISFGAYVSMFPQLIAGPIVRYKTIADQLINRRHSLEQFYSGVLIFTAGLAKKVLLANQAGYMFKEISTGSSIYAIDAIIGIIFYGFQIYFDFSGYSDMAIGLGKMFGFDIQKNFNYPYESSSITEFFRRWHISLGTWFREYVYIPLGGNRRHNIRNIMIVWLLTGIWHGASYNFVIWGVYFGIILIIEKKFLLSYLNKSRIWSHLYTIIVVLIGWVIFAFDNIGDGIRYFSNIFNGDMAGGGTVYLLYTNIIFLAILAIGSTSLPKKIIMHLRESMDNAYMETITECIFAVVLILLSTASIVDSSYNPFLYFRF